MHAELFLPPPYFTESSLEERKRQVQDSERRAAGAIRRVVPQAPYDLIVMGTHGRSGMNRLMQGSVTEHVVRGTSIPVLAVARQAPRTATGLARRLGAAVTVLHVREPGAKDTIEELWRGRRSRAPRSWAATCWCWERATGGSSTQP